jgi:hypothetical protein
MVQGLRFRVLGSGFEVQGSGFKVQGQSNFHYHNLESTNEQMNK